MNLKYSIILLLFTFVINIKALDAFYFGRWSIKPSKVIENNKIIEDLSTVILIDDKIIKVNANDAELTGSYDVNNDILYINDIKITKIPSMINIKKLYHQYKWIKYIQKNGIEVDINQLYDFNDILLLCKYKCADYNGTLTLKKII